MRTALKEKLPPEKKKALLKVLTYEKVRGKPIYYRDYRKVLEGELTPEGVMGSSELHAILLSLIVSFLKESLGREFAVLSGELGFILSSGSYRSLDVAIYRKEDIKKPSEGYTRTPPIVVIEIDTKADLSRYGSFEEYMYEKTKDLLEAGVKKVIWYVSKVKKVLIAESGKDWITKDWSAEVEVLEGIKLSLERLLKDEGIEI